MVSIFNNVGTCITCGRLGFRDLAINVSASLCSNMSFSPTLLFMIAFKHLMHSCCTLSHLLSLKRIDYSRKYLWNINYTCIYIYIILIMLSQTYFRKHSFSKESTCFNPLAPNSWIHSSELFVSATRRDSMQAYLVLRFKSGLLRYWI